MTAILTLEDRIQRETQRRRAAAARIIDDLRRFGTGRGRFIVFGSAARGEMTDESDLDLVIDFPADDERAAIEAVEKAARKYKLKIDFHLAPDIGPALKIRVDRDGVVL